MFGIDRDTVIATGERMLPTIDRVLMRSSELAESPILANGNFPWITELEKQWPVILAEAESLLKQRSKLPPVRELSKEHHKIAVDDRWRSFFLWGYGVRIDANCERCPNTAAIVDRIPGILGAFFSVMEAGGHIPRHTGPTKAILTSHLGLIVPRERERCHMDVAGNDVVWEPGRVVVFDDMYPHEVWNDTGEDRVILLLHIQRPLRFPGSVLRNIFFAALRASPFVRDGLRNLDDYSKKKAA